MGFQCRKQSDPCDQHRGQQRLSGRLYGEMSFDETGTAVYPLFSDITVGNGIITVAEQNSAHLYQYDSEGNLLAVFGGKGTLAGQFDVISSIAQDSQGRLYVLDSSHNTIQILEPTQMIPHGAGRPTLCIWTAIIPNPPTSGRRLCPWFPTIRWREKSIGKIQYKQRIMEAAKGKFLRSECP